MRSRQFSTGAFLWMVGVYVFSIALSFALTML